MSQHRVCPWWLGPLLACPLRRFGENPDTILSPYVRPGMTVLEPGPAMGFFTLELARLVGETGSVVAIDVQPKMLSALQRRAAKQGLLPRIQTRLAVPDSLPVEDLTGSVDFVLAFAVVHEMPSAPSFFQQAAAAMKPGAQLLFVEPSGHVKPAEFESSLQAALAAGLLLASRPAIRRNAAALLQKP